MTLTKENTSRETSTVWIREKFWIFFAFIFPEMLFSYIFEDVNEKERWCAVKSRKEKGKAGSEKKCSLIISYLREKREFFCF